MTALDRELIRERDHHDACRAALTGMVEGAAERVVTGESAFASGADAEVLGYQLRSWAKELRELPEGPLFFGRLDFRPGERAGDVPGERGEHAGQSYYIGRRRISEHPAAPPLVVDWRAPVSRAFYQAGARDPQGVEVRRRFGWAPFSKGASEDLTGLEDEYLQGGGPQGGHPDADAPGAGAPREGAPGTGVPGAAGPLGGSAILAREIERPRVGPMRDIAATIQPEQDDLVRAGLAQSLCVQGAPGTGKTAVGLHRAAYLLYTHPQRIQRSGLLILGPNRTFLTYISEVLPSLGELDIRQSTVDDEIARHPVRAADGAEAARVKHDARMAGVLHRALYGRIGAPVEDVEVPDGSYRWRIGVDELARIVAEVRAESPPYGVGRERVRSRAVRAVQLQAERRAGPMGNVWVQKIGRARPVTAFVDAVWPKARPEEVLSEFLAAPADPELAAAELAALRWAKPPRSFKSAKWSAADLVLLDELAGLIERPDGYGHIVVDEAQDLSPMQARAIARRAGFGSLTVLGDLAQGTTPWAADSWPELLRHLGKEDAELVPLTTGFRVPAVIVDFANRLLGSLGVDVEPGRSLRADGELRIRAADDRTAETVAAVREGLDREGSIGVIADGPEAERLRVALEGAGIPTAAADGAGAPARVTVLPASVAKGLEYDHVVVVEPAAIVAAESRGAHRLYVALTRAVSRLDVVHERALPQALLGGA